MRFFIFFSASFLIALSFGKSIFVLDAEISDNVENHQKINFAYGEIFQTFESADGENFFRTCIESWIDYLWLMIKLLEMEDATNIGPVTVLLNALNLAIHQALVLDLLNVTVLMHLFNVPNKFYI